MSKCMGYSYTTNEQCEDLTSGCNNHMGCINYNLTPLPETNYNMGHANDYPNSRGLRRENLATNSWPCRFQTSCNYFDKNNPIISEYVRKMDVMALPPN